MTILGLILEYLMYSWVLLSFVYMATRFFIQQYYPIDVILYEVRGGNLKPKKTYGRVFNKDGVQKIKFFKIKEQAEAPRLDFLYSLSKRRDHISYLRDANGFFHPAKLIIDFESNKTILNPDFRDKTMWAIQEHKEVEERYSKPKFMEKYGGFIALIITGIVCFLMLYVAGNTFSETVTTLTNQLAGFTEAIKTLTNELAVISGGN